MGALKLGLIAATLFIIAVVNDWSTPDRLIITLLAAFAITWVWSRLSLARLGLKRTLSLDRVRAGDWITEEFSLANQALLPKLWVEVRDLSSLPNHRAGRVVNVGSRSTSSWTVTTRCERRGRYRLGPLSISSGDPLGVFDSRKLIPATHELVVYPPQVDVSDVPIPMANMTGGRAINVNGVMAAHTISGIREYNVGDPLNRIAWSATARLGRMMVKEFDPDPTSDVWIMLDLNDPTASNRDDHAEQSQLVGPSTDEAQEYAIALAGSVAELCLDGGRKVGLIVNRAMPIRIDADNSQRQWFRIFESLAVASSFGKRPIEEAIQAEARRFSRSAGLIVITASSESHWVNAARSLVQRHVPVTAVLVADQHLPDAPAMQELASALVDVRVAVAQFSPGERLAAQASRTAVVA